eukprot:403345408
MPLSLQQISVSKNRQNSQQKYQIQKGIKETVDEHEDEHEDSPDKQLNKKQQFFQNKAGSTLDYRSQIDFQNEDNYTQNYGNQKQLIEKSRDRFTAHQPKRAKLLDLNKTASFKVSDQRGQEKNQNYVMKQDQAKFFKMRNLSNLSTDITKLRKKNELNASNNQYENMLLLAQSSSPSKSLTSSIKNENVGDNHQIRQEFVNNSASKAKNSVENTLMFSGLHDLIISRRPNKQNASFSYNQNKKNSRDRKTPSKTRQLSQNAKMDTSSKAASQNFSSQAQQQFSQQPILRNIYELNTSTQQQRILTDSEDRSLQLSFKLFDLEGTGFIKKEDLQRIIQNMGYKIGREDAQDIYSMSQINRGEFSLDQLREIFKSKVFKADFRLMDVDNVGYITQANLKRILNHELQLDISDELLQDMIEECDFDGDGVISQNDYSKLMKKFKKLSKSI